MKEKKRKNDNIKGVQYILALLKKNFFYLPYIYIYIIFIHHIYQNKLEK